METTLQVLNDLERAGVVRRYAIGGAMGATFYVEPVLTFSELVRSARNPDQPFIQEITSRSFVAHAA